ncbi:MAG: 2-amino-4-hydroxy-6-hydroxymethyldihydropteridine diphosphokinase [Burkholderiales bacterium]
MSGESATDAFVGLGSNLEDPVSQLRIAFEELAALPGTRLVAQSSLYRSAPVGYLEQPDFVNAVAKLHTTLAARELLEQLLAIELRHKRVRTYRNAPRILDLDLLLFGGFRSDEPGLTLPHPKMHERAFVLVPIREIAPGLTIPGIGDIDVLLARCADQKIEKMP